MVKIRVDDVRPGFILQKDVMGKTKNPIIPANTVLTDQHIHILKMFFIQEVEVITATNLNKSNREVLGISFHSSYIKAVEHYKREFQSWQAGVSVDILSIRKIILPLIKKYKDEKSWLQKIHLYSTKKIISFIMQLASH
ncbi:hypothetical protein ACI2OX_22010 [Bacillus sp. N9]